MDSIKPMDLNTFLPVDLTDTGSIYKYPEKGIALCLSGGGYRAMLFHLGALWRLNELGYLKKIRRISSVSGGSITATALAYKWDKCDFDDDGIGQRFIEEVVEPIRRLGSKTIDISAVLKGLVFPGSHTSSIRNAFRKYLFGSATMQELPDEPRFVINASNVQSGVLWRFMKPHMMDYRVGMIRNPSIELAEAVAASSACPPLLSPYLFRFQESGYTPYHDPYFYMQYTRKPDLGYKPYTTRVCLTDGGVYDNLGLETAWKRFDTVLVSDAGSKMGAIEKPRKGYLRHSMRIVALIDNQVRSLRKRQLIESFKLREKMLVHGDDPESDLFRIITRKGAYWGIYSDIANYGLSESFDCPFESTQELASIKTRFKKISLKVQDRLINWGYAICDAAMRKHVDASLPCPERFPYEGGVQ